MKILFLDIDGVLNSEEWFSGTDSTPGQQGKLDPRACTLLEQAIQQTGCQLVLSSSWRSSMSAQDVETLLHARGVHSAKVVGLTGPDFRTRDAAILLWVEENGITEWAAIDDNTLPQVAALERAVKTEYDKGMEPGHVEALVQILGLSEVATKWAQMTESIHQVLTFQKDSTEAKSQVRALLEMALSADQRETLLFVLRSVLARDTEAK